MATLLTGSAYASNGVKKPNSIIAGQNEKKTQKEFVKSETWQCYSYHVQNCCGLNGIACADSYAAVVAMIESLIGSFCPTCNCEP